MRVPPAYASDMAVAALASYAIGMLPTALIVGRCIGRHPTSEGSGNPGASNMYRIGGLKAASVVGIVDTAKGALPALAALALWGRNEALAAWLGATAGHVWPVLGLLPGLDKLRGGKGVATAGGGALVLQPLLASISLMVFVSVLLWRRVAALASAGGSRRLPHAGHSRRLSTVGCRRGGGGGGDRGLAASPQYRAHVSGHRAECAARQHAAGLRVSRMIPLPEALSHVLERVERLPQQAVALDRALGLVLAEPVVSSEAVPPFDNTAVDGFAVRSGDAVEAPVTLEVVGTIAAGDDPAVRVGPGQAARIMTGAPIPDGADAVVMVERTRLVRQAGSASCGRCAGSSGRCADSPGEQVVLECSVAHGDHVRAAGDDLTPGEEVLPAGVRLTPGCLGVLASIGAYRVRAYRCPRVGVLSTGDELVDGPGPLRRGEIRDSNRRSLLGLLAESGFTGVDLGVVRDEESRIEAVLRSAAEECDAVLSSGGVSMGDHDYVKAVLDRLGDMRWMQIAIKPAKPFAFGLVRGTPVFGLPGNPVSSMVSFKLLAEPALRAMSGCSPDDLEPSRARAVSRTALPRPRDGKTHFARVSAERDSRGVLRVAALDGQGSHQLAVMARADALAAVPPEPPVGPGDAVDVILLSRR